MESELDISVEELQQESATRFADTGAPGEPGAVEHSDAAAATDQGTNTQDNQAHAPDPAGYPTVLDSFPAELRTQLDGLDEQTLMELSKGFTRQQDYTRKTQDLAEARRELNADATDANAWRKLLENPHARSAVLRSLESNGGEEGEQGFDWTTAESSEIDQEVERRAAAIAEQIVEQRVSLPQQRQHAIKAEAIGTRKAAGDAITDDQFRGAYQTMIQKYGEENITPENVGLLLEPFVEIAKLKGQLTSSQGYIPGVDRMSRATSTPGVGSIAPRVKPRWEVEKRSPTEVEKVQATLARVAQTTGQRLTMKDLDDLLERGDT